MPKPTLIQSLLGRPSQSYSFPPQKEYHSTKNELIRAATTLAFEEDRHASTSDPALTVPHSELPPPPPPPPHDPLPVPRSRRLRRQARPPNTPHEPPELLPSRSLIRRIASSTTKSSLQKQKNGAHYHAAPQPPYISQSPAQPRSPPDRRFVDLTVVEPTVVDPPAPGGPDDSPDSESDVFYTPRSSLAPSPSTDAMLLEPQALATALLPIHGRRSSLKSSLAPPELSQDPYNVDPDVTITITPGPGSRASSEVDSAPVSRTPSDSSLSSCSGVSASVSVATDHDSVSLFDCGETTSTRITTPVGSEHGPSRSKSDEDAGEAITIISSSSIRRPRPLSIDLSPSALAPSVTERATRRHSQPARSDEDWAKDVRWLVPPAPSPSPVSPTRPRPPNMHPASNSPRRRSRPLHPDLLPPPPLPINLPAPHQLDRQSFPDVPTVAMPTPRPVRPRNKEHRSSRHSSNRHSKTRMSALWEEDESECSTDVGASSAEVSRASTPAPMPYAEGYMSVGFAGVGAARSATPPPGWPYAGVGTSSGAGMSGSGSLPMQSTLRQMSGFMQRRASMSESELLMQMQADSAPPSPGESPDSRLQDYARARKHPRSISFSSPTPSPFLLSGSPGRSLSPLAMASSSTGLPTHAIPAPLSASAPGTVANSGYTGLTLPHASYTPKSGKPLADGHVDLVRSGRAQTSMATVEVVRGAAAAVSSTNGKRLSRSFSLNIGKSKDKRKRDATPAHLRGTLPLPVAFTAHIPPPSFVPSSHVLVQVFAVGLDGLDSLIVQEKAESRGGGGGSMRGKGKRRGFIPGRSFVGRAIECGFEVNKDVCKKGEWVVGLLDVRKCGALAEFVLVERHRLFRCPQPRARPSHILPSRRRTHSHTRTLSLPSASAAPVVGARYATSPLAPPAPLTIEELALLPLCGLPAYRAVRSFAEVLAYRSGKSRERPRVLILMGHDGPGAMALQMVGRKRGQITVQVPDSAARELDEKEDSSEEGSSARMPAYTRRQRVDARLRAWGAEEVCFGDPLSVLEKFVDDGRSFDAILDTVGGVCIWEAAQRLLAYVPSAAATQSAPALSGPISSESPTGEDYEEEKKRAPSYAQFTTLVGDMPSRAIPKAHDNLRSGLRSLRRAMSTSGSTKGSGSSSSGRVFGTNVKGKVKRTVGYAWISVAADVDEGEDVRDSLGAVVSMVEDGVIRPWVGHGEEGEEDRIVPFEQAPEAFRRDANGPKGVLKDGGTCVVKIGA